jgi:hypothetical protein
MTATRSGTRTAAIADGEVLGLSVFILPNRWFCRTAFLSRVGKVAWLMGLRFLEEEFPDGPPISRRIRIPGTAEHTGTGPEVEAFAE